MSLMTMRNIHRYLSNDYVCVLSVPFYLLCFMMLLSFTDFLYSSRANCVNKHGRHWFRWLLVACLTPSHYFNHSRVIINWAFGNINLWNLNKNRTTFKQKNAFANVICKMAAILSRPPCVSLQYTQNAYIDPIRGLHSISTYLAA